MIQNPSASIIPVAFVGLGRSGWNIHFKPISKMPGFKVVAVADPAAERCQEAVDLTGCKAFASIDELLANTDAQFVVVATPSMMHYEDATKVLNSGRHCLVEKPMAMTQVDADRLVALAKEKGLHLFTNHTHLFLADYHHLRKVIDSNILGPLFHFRCFWSNYRRRWDWQTLRKNGGGELNNTCSHALTVVLPLLGSPVKSVTADLRNIKNAGDTEDHVQLLLRTESGITADVTVTTAFALDGVPKWILAGKYGSLVSDGVVSKIRYYDPSKLPPISAFDAAAPNREYGKETIPWEDKELPVEPSVAGSPHQNIYDVLTGQAQAVVTPESAAEVVRVTEMAALAGGALQK